MKNLDEGKSMDTVYLDLRKAFDTVPHQRLLRKLHCYGIRGEVHNWIADFLHNRKQRVVIGNCKSDWTPVTSGIPQGSVLGPVLFLLYINDLPDVVKAVIQMFSDDSKIYKEIANSTDNEELQKDLSSMETCTVDWQLPFNENKCKVMHLGRNNIRHKYKMKGGNTLEETTCEKDLGILVDNNLTFSDHIQKVASKSNSILGLIRRSYTYLNCEVMRNLYLSLVRPQLEYGNVVWSPLFKKDAAAVEEPLNSYHKLNHCHMLNGCKN